MLSRPKRLPRASFGRVQAGKRALSKHFSVSFGPSGSRGGAVVISKKTAKLSTDRHRLKRRILSVTEPFIDSGRAFIVYARAGSPLLSYPKLKKELEELFSSLPSTSR